MDCAGVDLVAYHFATLDDDARDAIDAHLLECKTCLRAYLSLKRTAEKGPLDRPSKNVRERLRADVERTFAKKRVVFFQRKIPLYQGLAFAALAAAITIFVLGHHGPVREGVPQVDTSRAHAEAFQIY
jgi:hypothetical protein